MESQFTKHARDNSNKNVKSHTSKRKIQADAQRNKYLSIYNYVKGLHIFYRFCYKVTKQMTTPCTQFLDSYHRTTTVSVDDQDCTVPLSLF